ncbi:GspE/PulE family protein [Candidatus Deianiraea vastatrix]|uniref:PulE/PilB-like type II secretion/type IV pilus ATPase n=1 Tax=Candidatus Deianiraea vastatrix TaxID=2163644 RepID=A0A5B8XEQ0_9RICK|nr:GspE/PulE family protein [Candidatus Deianiraea vastatrix]QED23720.1 Putative PulE/PilB-like type II secretion/type IV pilus ATPase [Candidatus Deianiraea vastatrix]
MGGIVGFIMEDFAQEDEEYRMDAKQAESLVERLLSDKIIDEIQLQTIRDEVQQTGQDVISALIAAHLVSDNIIQSYIRNVDVKSIDLAHTAIDPNVARKLAKHEAVSNVVIAFYEDSREVGIATVDPDVLSNIDGLSSYFDGKDIVPYLAKQADILAAIDKSYEYEFNISKILKELASASEYEFKGMGNSYQSPVVRIVDALLSDAVHKGASDIHIQPDAKFVRVRYRMDGMMNNQFTFDVKYYPSITVRIKIIGGMNIAESIRPQDGAIQSTIMGRKIDFRVSLMPTVFGESIVIRVLDKNESVSSLSNFNFSKDNETKIRKLLSKPEGVLIMTGPTGSGKTTTLYAMMSEIASPRINMMTLEDPVEYHMPLAKQMNVNDAAGITFAGGLRAILRQDPDVILVGEMRDEETAITAMRAAMTGHKVFSTLHTNDAPSAVNRLLDLGVSRHIIASSVNGIIAQRLIRRLCPDCKKARLMRDDEFARYKIKKVKDIKVYDAGSCKNCHNIGYKGRCSVIEVLSFDSMVKSMIEDGASEHAIVGKAKEAKTFVPIQIDAIKKVIGGVSSFDEVSRVIDMSDYIV